MRETVYLEEWCQKKGMTQAEVGRIAGFRSSHLSRIAIAHRAYSETRKEIEAALGVQPGDLLRNPDPRIGIDLLEILKDPRLHIGNIPIRPKMKSALHSMIVGLLPLQR